MYYKLLYKNLLTAALVSFITLNAAKPCEAQGVVSLVEDNETAAPENNANEAALPSADLSMDTELPNTLPNDDVIPLDNAALISPAPATEAPAPAPVPAPAVQPATENAAAGTNAAPAPDSFNQDMDFSLGIENDIPAAPAAQPGAANTTKNNPLMAPAAEQKAPAPKSIEEYGDDVLAKIDNDLFSQMSDIEKQTTLLTLELRREKIRNEIEAIRAQRERAEEEKIAAEEEKKRKEFEWKKEQEAKVLKEQQLLKEKEIELEKLKQKKVLNAYMNRMLEENQKWIAENAEIYKQMRQVEADRKSLVENFKQKLEALNTLSNKAIQSANNAKSNHDRTLASLTAQNIQLKKRIEAEALAAKNRQENPFGNEGGEGGNKNAAVTTSIDAKIVPINISKEYAIMDITGQGDDLVAKLINKEGESFLARKGTILQTGHAIEAITPNYIQFDRNGLKDYLYTSGSAMTMEPENMEGTATTNAKAPRKPAAAAAPKKASSGIASERGVPSLGAGMFVK